MAAVIAALCPPRSRPRCRWALTALAAAVALSACAGPGSRARVASYESRCQEDIDAVPDLALLREYMPVQLKDARTAAMRQNTMRPTARQRVAIERFDRVKMACQRHTMVALTERGTPAPVLAVLDESARAGQALRLQLARGELSFGEFNRRAEAQEARTKQALEQALAAPAGAVNRR